MESHRLSPSLVDSQKTILLQEPGDDLVLRLSFLLVFFFFFLAVGINNRARAAWVLQQGSGCALPGWIKHAKNTHVPKEDLCASAGGARLLSEGQLCTESCPGVVALCVRRVLHTVIISNLAKYVPVTEPGCVSGV